MPWGKSLSEKIPRPKKGSCCASVARQPGPPFGAEHVLYPFAAISASLHIILKQRSLKQSLKTSHVLVFFYDWIFGADGLQMHPPGS